MRARETPPSRCAGDGSSLRTCPCAKKEIRSCFGSFLNIPRRVEWPPFSLSFCTCQIAIQDGQVCEGSTWKLAPLSRARHIGARVQNMCVGSSSSGSPRCLPWLLLLQVGHQRRRDPRHGRRGGSCGGILRSLGPSPAHWPCPGPGREASRRGRLIKKLFAPEISKAARAKSQLWLFKTFKQS